MSALLASIALLAARAQEEPTASVGAGVAVSMADLRAPGVPGAAGVVGAELPFAGPVALGVEGELGIEGDGAPMGGGRLAARVAVVGPLAVQAGVGAGWQGGRPTPLTRFGADVDVPAARARVRISLAAELSDRGVAPVLGLGVLRTLAPRTPAGVSTARPAPMALRVEPPDALVWVPHPVCAWLPPDEAEALLGQVSAELPTDLPLEVRAEGHLPAEVPPDGEVELEPTPGFGAVVVVAQPGDRVSIDGAGFPVAPDGAAVFGAPEGPLRVTVTGAGRTVTLEGAVALGHALWLRAPAPEPLVLAFAAGSSALPTDAVAQLRAFAALAGDHRFRVVGSYSGEAALGETRRLADARAEALVQALLDAGIPVASIQVLSTSDPGAALPVERLRSARVEVALPAELP